MPQKPTHTAPLLGSQSAAYGYEHKYVGDSASHSVTPSHTMTKLGYMAYSSSASMDWYSRDSKIGYSYFGARYYNSDISVWLSACHPQLQRRRMDLLADRYPNEPPYCYAGWNPVIITDPNGMWKGDVDKNGKVTYVAEKGDTKETFREQYSDLFKKDVEAIFKSNDSKLTYNKKDRSLKDKVILLSLLL